MRFILDVIMFDLKTKQNPNPEFCPKKICLTASWAWVRTVKGEEKVQHKYRTYKEKGGKWQIEDNALPQFLKYSVLSVFPYKG